MAEAHSAVHLLELFDQSQTKQSKVIYDDDEILTIRINKTLYQSFLRYLKDHAVGLRNEVLNSIFPHSFFNCIVSLVAPPIIMFSRHAAKLPIIRNAHSILWRIASGLPLGRLAPNGRAAITSVLSGYRGWMYEAPRQQSWKTLGWCVGVKLLTGSRPLLFSFQRSLPRLPVPALQDTVTRYLETIKHILPPEEYAKHERDAQKFLEKEGNTLQRYLILKSWVTDNYVSDWWEKYVYLRGRSPIMINSNYYVARNIGSRFPAHDQGVDNGDLFMYQTTTSQTSRAANLMHRMLLFKDQVDTQDLQPMSIRDTVPMCMSQYKRVFSTTRIPGLECDEIVHLGPRESKHVAVLCNGSWFAIDVYTRSGDLLMAHEIEAQLDKVLSISKTLQPTSTEAQFPALTAGDRTLWAEARERFFKHGINHYSLDMIERALFVVVLDPRVPADITEQSHLSMHGSGYDRYFDKSFSLIVYGNGKAGLNCEHSWADAPVIGHMWEYGAVVEAIEGCYNSAGKCIVPPNAKKRPLPAPIVLQWSLNAPEVKRRVEDSVKSAQQLIEDLQISNICFDEFGKELISKKMRVSPDAYLQQALQLAYARDTNGQVALTYESSMTRLYQLGRTETVRSATQESRDWVVAMLDESRTALDRAKLFRKACDRHQSSYRDAMSGRGVDRHLFALYVVSQGIGVNSDFLVDALKEPWRLSTSQQPQSQTNFWNPSGDDSHLISYGGGFGPVADDGYGVSYMVAGENLLFFNISAKKSCPTTDSDRFGENIKSALREIRHMFESAEQEKQRDVHAKEE